MKLLPPLRPMTLLRRAAAALVVAAVLAFPLTTGAKADSMTDSAVFAAWESIGNRFIILFFLRHQPDTAYELFDSAYKAKYTLADNKKGYDDITSHFGSDLSDYNLVRWQRDRGMEQFVYLFDYASGKKALFTILFDANGHITPFYTIGELLPPKKASGAGTTAEKK